MGIARSEKVVVITVTSRPRGQESKLNFYKELCRELTASCGITPNDVIVSMVINSDEDWSFGNGLAQFITGDL